MEAIQNYYPAYNPYQYQYPPIQQNKPQPTASAVTINIIEPKAYAGGEAPQYPMPIYGYPQASIYNQPGAYYPPPVMPPVPYPMPQNQAQVINQAPQMPEQQIPQQYPPQMPPQQYPPQLPEQQIPQQPQQVPQQPQQPQQPEVPQLSVNDLPAINAALAQGDSNIKAAAIEAVARIGQGDANTYTALLNEVNQDTSKMGGDAKAVAEQNKKHAMWTLSILNKNQNPQVPLNDLPGAKEVFNVLKSDPSPDMRKAAISALDFLSKPEDAALLSKIYEIAAKRDKNPEVSALAKQALANIQQGQKAA